MSKSARHTGVKSCAIGIVRDKINVVTTKCRGPRGGAKSAGIPHYTLVVTNPILPEDP